MVASVYVTLLMTTPTIMTDKMDHLLPYAVDSRRAGTRPKWNLRQSLYLWFVAFLPLVVPPACVSPSRPATHPLATFYLYYAAFPQGYFNSGLLDAGGIYVYYADAEKRGQKPIIRRLTPQLDASAWNAPSAISQRMTATAGGSLLVDPSVINPAWQFAIKAGVLRETTLDLREGKKYELRDPDSLITSLINDPKYIGQFRGYTDASRYTILVVDSYVDGKITVSAGAAPKSNRISVTVLGKQPVVVDVSNLHFVDSSGPKILVGFKTYILRGNADGSLDVAEDRRSRPWSEALTKSSPF